MVAHQLADVLDLPAAGLVRADAAGLDDRVREPFGQVELLQSPRVERDQGLAQVLQRVHLVLAPRLGRRQAFVVCLVLLLVGSGDHSVGRDAGKGSQVRAFAIITDRFP